MSSAPGPKTAVRGERFVSPLLAVAVVASMAVLLAYRSHLGWLNDDWEFVIYRHTGSINDYFDPHNEHISILTVALYRLVLGIFGMGSAMPMHVIATAVFALSAVLLFIYMRRRVGPWPALIGTSIVLFLGSAWEDLLWAFQVGFFLSVAFGIGALLALDRNDRRGDRIACVLLVLSTLPSSMGLSFIAGAGIEWLLNGRDRLRRLYVPLVPLVTYVVWYLGWGHKAANGLSLHNVFNSPVYTVKAIAEGTSDLTGLMHYGGSRGNTLALISFAVVVAGFTFHIWRTRRISTGLLVTLAIGLSFWILAGFNQIPGRDFDASRYQYPSVVFILLILANGFEGVVIRPRYLVAMGAVAMVAIYSNLLALNAGYVGYFKPQTQRDIASLSALEIAGPKTDPDASVGMNNGDTALINSGGYQDARKRYGPAVDPRKDIPGLSPENKQRADLLLAALSVKAKQLKKVPREATCRVLTETTGGNPLVSPGSDTLIFNPSRSSIIVAERFGSQPSSFGIAAAGIPTSVRFPPDSYPGKWKVGLKGGPGKFRLCRIRTSR